MVFKLKIYYFIKGDLKNDSYYLFFQNMTQVNGFKGFVGFMLRELSENETNLYCSCFNETIKSAIPPPTQSRLNFTSDFMLRSYTSGCYYYNTETGKWSSNGMDVYEDTNLEQTHCTSSHLTAFAGGLVLASTNINFEYPISNASITFNPIIYATVIFFVLLYIFFAIWSRVMDKRDEKKMRVYPMKDNYPNDAYFYEVIVFTGNRSLSGTKSKVNGFLTIRFLKKLDKINNFFFLKG